MLPVNLHRKLLNFADTGAYLGHFAKKLKPTTPWDQELTRGGFFGVKRHVYRYECAVLNQRIRPRFLFLSKSC